MDEDKKQFEGGATRSTVEHRFDLIPAEAELAYAARCSLGEQQHGEGNWHGGGVDFIKTCINHLQRHTALMKAGTHTNDDHIGAILWNAGALAWFRAHKPTMLDQALLELREGKLTLERGLGCK